MESQSLQSHVNQKQLVNKPIAVPSLQSSDDPRKFVIESIEKHIEKAKRFAETCDLEATKSTELKRRGRWINGILGGLTALLGIVITALPSDADDIRKYIGLAGAITGSIVATAGQFIDPAKSRQRAIDLKTLKIRLDNFTEQQEVIFRGLKNSEENIEALRTLHEDFTGKLLELQNEAFNRGVDV